MEASRDLEGADDASPVLNKSSNENTFVSVLRNDLVRDKILFFLSFEDIKALSAVSVKCNGAVRSNDEFRKRARLIICQESVASELLQKTCYKWRQISMDLRIPALEAEQIAYLLPSAKAISLWLSEGTDTDTLQINCILTEILGGGATVLESLEMETSIFKNDLTDVFSNPIVQTTLSNLKVFVIQSKIRKETCSINGVENQQDFSFQRNFRLLAETPLKLKKFVFGKVVMGHDESECCHVKFIPKIVNSTKDTLEELELHLNVWKLKEMMEICCSKLKGLVLSAHGTPQKEAEIIEKFLRNQPPLETLEIEIKKEFPLSILQTFPEIIDQMKKLHITLKNIKTDAPVNWTFLETMNQLKDFRIQKTTFPPLSYPHGYKAGAEFPAILPSGLEKISMRRFPIFWMDSHFLGSKAAVLTKNIGDLLSRFVNLTELDLWNSGGSITDLGMQRIITNCKKLTSLTFSHSLWLTDFGISGVKISEDGSSEEKLGVSLNDLKGLLRLRIRVCPYVSAEWMLKVVKFDFLRFFDYDKFVREPKVFLAQIARQNSCLEEATLRIWNDLCHGDEYVRNMKQEMKQTNPRIRLIIIPPPTKRELEDSDSDSSM